MLIEKAYESGRHIRKAVLNKNGDLTIIVNKLQQTTSKHDLAYEYSRLLLDYNVGTDNRFMIDMLSDETDYRDVYICLCMGILSEDEDSFILASKATNLWNLKDSTIRKAIHNKRLIDGKDCYKDGRNWNVKISAMERVFGERKF